MDGVCPPMPRSECHLTEKGAAPLKKTKGGICDPTRQGASPSSPPGGYGDADAIRQPLSGKPEVVDFAILRIPLSTVAGPIPALVTVNATEPWPPAGGQGRTRKS